MQNEWNSYMKNRNFQISQHSIAYWVNFRKTWHKASLDDWDSNRSNEGPFTVSIFPIKQGRVIEPADQKYTYMFRKFPLGMQTYVYIDHPVTRKFLRLKRFLLKMIITTCILHNILCRNIKYVCMHLYLTYIYQYISI